MEGSVLECSGIFAFLIQAFMFVEENLTKVGCFLQR